MREIFQAIALNGAVFLDAEFTSPWCISARIGPDDCAPFGAVPHSIIAFHYVYEGSLIVEMEGHTPVIVSAGEFVMLPRNEQHQLASAPELVAVSADHLIDPGADGTLATIRHGGGGETTRVVCGFLGSDQARDPLLMLLPSMMKLAVPEGAWADWFHSSFKLAAKHTVAGSHQPSTTLVKLSEILFVDAMNRYLDETSAQPGNKFSGIADPRIARALGLLRERLQHRWTADELAREVGMSRSAFTERFVRVVGEAPMHYLIRQRLQTAGRHLLRSNDSLARIAFEVGYESEAAFNRAFKREFGEPPASWRGRNGR